MSLDIEIIIPYLYEGFYRPHLQICKTSDGLAEWQPFEFEQKVKFSSRREALKFAVAQSLKIVNKKYGAEAIVRSVAFRVPELAEDGIADVGMGILEVRGCTDILHTVGDNGKLVTLSFNSAKTAEELNKFIGLWIKNGLGGWSHDGVTTNNAEANKSVGKYKISFKKVI